MSYELNKHKRSDTIKWVAVFLIVILLAVAVFALVAKVYNAACWLEHEYGEDNICVRCGAEKPIDEDKPADDTEQDADGNGGMELDTEKVVENGIALLSIDIPRALYSQYDIAPIAESAKQLTATVTPANATYTELDWSIAFKNPSSSWANGKNVSSYVTLNADGLKATVSCLQAFGEQIIIKATSLDNPAISATCTVDYEKRVSGYTVTLGGVSGFGGVLTPTTQAKPSTLPILKVGEGYNYTPTITFNESVGTISKVGTFSYRWRVGISPSFRTLNSSTKYYSDGSYLENWSSGSKSWPTVSVLVDLFNLDTKWEYEDWEAAHKEAYKICSTVIQKGAGMDLLRLQLELTYGGSTVTTEYYLGLNCDAFRTAVTGLSFGNTSFTF